MLNRRKSKAALFAYMKIGSANECWVWQAGTNGRYGHVHFEKKVWLTHRLSFAIYHGEIPPNRVIHHMCSNRLCANPGHLTCITKTQNNRLAAESGFRKGEQNPNNRLNRDQVLMIKILKQVKNFSQKQIAEVTGFHRSTVNDICRGRTWNHISL